MSQPLIEVQEMVWSRLGLRKWMVGRERVATATASAIRRWPERIHITANRSFAITYDKGEIAPTVTDSFVENMAAQVTADTHATGPKCGSLLGLVLSAVIGQIVRLLLDWWLDRRENQELLAAARAQLEAVA